MSKDSEFLGWLADRLVNVYGENPNVDFVRATRRIAAALASREATEDGYAKAFYEIASVLGIGARADTPENVFRNEMLPKIKLMAEVFGDKYCSDCRKAKGVDPAAQAASASLADEFEIWVKRAYRDAYEATFTVYNMEVAWHAGRAAALASPQVAPALSTMQAFEEWYCRDGNYEPEELDKWAEGTCYSNADTENMWQAWQGAFARRAAPAPVAPTPKD